MARKRSDHLLAWWIGLVIILAAMAYTAHRFSCLDCQPAGYLQFIVIGIVPAIYLALMYLTFKSQEDSEQR